MPSFRRMVVSSDHAFDCLLYCSSMQCRAEESTFCHTLSPDSSFLLVCTCAYVDCAFIYAKHTFCHNPNFFRCMYEIVPYRQKPQYTRSLNVFSFITSLYTVMCSFFKEYTKFFVSFFYFLVYFS